MPDFVANDNSELIVQMIDDETGVPVDISTATSRTLQYWYLANPSVQSRTLTLSGNYAGKYRFANGELVVGYLYTRAVIIDATGNRFTQTLPSAFSVG